MICPVCGEANSDGKPTCASCRADLTPPEKANLPAPAGKDTLEIVNLWLGILGILLAPFVFAVIMGLWMPKHINFGFYLGSLLVAQPVSCITAIVAGGFSKTLKEKRRASRGILLAGYGTFFAILGLIAFPVSAYIGPGFIRCRWEGQFMACKHNVMNLGTALEMYATDNGGQYPPSLKYLAPDYLWQIPTCPSAGKDTYSSSYLVGQNFDAYTFYCSGANHTDVQGVGPNFPEYSSLSGLLEKQAPRPISIHAILISAILAGAVLLAVLMILRGQARRRRADRIYSDTLARVERRQQEMQGNNGYEVLSFLFEKDTPPEVLAPYQALESYLMGYPQNTATVLAGHPEAARKDIATFIQVLPVLEEAFLKKQYFAPPFRSLSDICDNPHHGFERTLDSLTGSIYVLGVDQARSGRFLEAANYFLMNLTLGAKLGKLGPSDFRNLGLSILYRGLHALLDLAATRELDPSACRKILARLEALPLDPGDLAQVVDEECANLLKNLGWTSRPDPPREERPPGHQDMSGLTSWLRQAGMRRARGTVAAWHLLHRPYFIALKPPQRPAFSPLEKKLRLRWKCFKINFDSFIRGMLPDPMPTGLLMLWSLGSAPPAIKSGLDSRFESDLIHTRLIWTMLSALQIMLSLRLYRIEKGNYPPDLAQLVPDYLPALPRNYLTDEGGFRYHPEGQGYTLWTPAPGYTLRSQATYYREMRLLERVSFMPLEIYATSPAGIDFIEREFSVGSETQLPSPERIRVLFLCTGNSCRSQMAEGWTRHLKGQLIEAYSAGIEKHGLDPLAIKVMAEAKVDIRLQYSKLVGELPTQEFDYVVTMCDQARETCPYFPGRAKIVHVGFDDPPRLAQGATRKAALAHYRRVRDEIRAFVETLPAALTRPDS